MLAVGRERAAKAGRDIEFTEANAEALPFADRSFDAVTIAFGIRNVPRIDVALGEIHRVLKTGGHFLCLEFSSVDVPGLDRLYDLYSFNVIPAVGRAVTGDAEAYRYLVELIRKFPAACEIRRHDPRRGLPPRVVHAPDRRRGRAAFRLAVVMLARCCLEGPLPRERAFTPRKSFPLPNPPPRAGAIAFGATRVVRTLPRLRGRDREGACNKHRRRSGPLPNPPPRAGEGAHRASLVISALSHLARLARAGFVFAREGVFALPDPRQLPVPARAVIRLARLIERPTSASVEHRLSTALTRLGPTYVKLGQFLATRPDVVGMALARDLETLQDKMPPFPQAEAEAAIAIGARQAGERDLQVVRPAGRGRLDRAGAPRRDRDRRWPQAGRRQGAAARHRAPRPRRARRLHVRRENRREPFRRGAAAAPDRDRQHAAPLGRDRDGPAPRGRGAVRDGGEHQGRSGFPRAHGRLGPHRQGRADAGLDRRHAAQRPRPARCAWAST